MDKDVFGKFIMMLIRILIGCRPMDTNYNRIADAIFCLLIAREKCIYYQYFKSGQPMANVW
jgi:hypothetical protein